MEKAKEKRQKPKSKCMHGLLADHCYPCKLKLTAALKTIIETLGVKKGNDDEQRKAVRDFTETTTLLPVRG